MQNWGFPSMKGVDTRSNIRSKTKCLFPTQIVIFIVHQWIKTSAGTIFNCHTNTWLQASPIKVYNVWVVHNAVGKVRLIGERVVKTINRFFFFFWFFFFLNLIIWNSFLNSSQVFLSTALRTLIATLFPWKSPLKTFHFFFFDWLIDLIDIFVFEKIKIPFIQFHKFLAPTPLWIPNRCA